VHASIRTNFDRALAEVRAVSGVRDVAAAKGQGGPAEAGAVLFETTAADFLRQRRLGDEIYGPAMVTVRCASRDELLAAARALHGHLTATVHGTAADFRDHGDLLAILRTKAGRLVCNGVPTGVEVVPAMQHGGPWPASSDARYSAVGTSSILRWARPVCFQDWPPEHLPEELRDGNPRGIFRMVDGVLARH
jgi:NADP-dependent aldehyde dehydrogenase